MSGSLGGRVQHSSAAPIAIPPQVITAAITEPQAAPTDYSWDFDATDTGTITTSGGSVSLWTNRAGAAMNLQKQGSVGPLLGRTINGLDTFEFTAGGGRALIASVALTVPQPFTFYVVCQPDSDAGGSLMHNTTSGARFGIQTTDTGNLYAGSALTAAGFTDGFPHVVTVFLDGASSGIRIDDGAITTGNAGTASLFVGAGGPVVGGFVTDWWDGLIGKILGWDRHLDTGEDALVLGSLMTTWGI